MDRFLIASVAFSAGAHAIVFAALPYPGGGGPAGVMHAEMELRYVPRAGRTIRMTRHPAAAHERPERPVPPVAPPCVPPVFQGTGEIFSGVVNETLRPLLTEEEAASTVFSAAVERYKKRLERILEKDSELSYPRMAREEGRQARVLLRFCIHSDGTLESVELPPDCGGFADEVVEGLRKASKPFPPFPEGLACTRLVFCWPVHFNLY